jgi:transcription antitermination factor NusG
MQTMEMDVVERQELSRTEWFAVHTRYQHEQQVNEQLGRKGFETFYPTCSKWNKWSDRKKKISHPLFPGYLFVTDVENRRLQVVETHGVCGIVSVAGMPAPIPATEIEAIRRAVASPYTIEAHEYLNAGDQVRVIEGPLTGVTGILARNDKSARLVLSVELLGRSVAVEIAAGSVERRTTQSMQ